MKIKSLFITTFLVITIACSNDDNGSPGVTSLLTLTVDASYLDEEVDESEDWIIVHSEKGDLLAFESFEANQQLEIVTNKSATGKIMVTHLNYRSQDGFKVYKANGYANIEKGKHMIISGVDPAPESTGNLSVSVNNLTSLEAGILCNRTGHNGGTSWNSGTGVLEFNANTFTGVSKHIAIVSDGDLLKYKILDNVEPNDTYNFSFDDMDEVDHKVIFTFPPAVSVMFNVFGSEPDATLKPNSYILKNDLLLFKNATTVTAGYLNSLTNYQTFLNISLSDRSYTYLNVGAIPDSQIEWPEKSDFTVIKNSFSNFSATSSKPYLWRKSLWTYQDVVNKIQVSWIISATSENQLIKELPSEITSAHPILSPANLNYAGTTFYTQSPAFESLVNHEFGSSPHPTGILLGVSGGSD